VFHTLSRLIIFSTPSHTLGMEPECSINVDIMDAYVFERESKYTIPVISSVSQAVTGDHLF